MANANGKAEAPAAATGSEATEQGEAAAAAAASPAPHTRWVQRTGSVRLPFREPSASGEATDIKQLLSVAAASAFVGAAATAALFSTWVQRMKPPRLLYAPTAANAALLRAVPLLHRHYVPHLLAWNAHLAGVFGYFKLPVPRLFFERLGPRTERIVLSDGGSVSLLWSSPADAVADGAPILLLLPGINNDASMGYLQHVQAVVTAALPRVAVAALNWRGLGGMPLTSDSGPAKPYSAACHTDVAEVLAHLRRRRPSSRLYAVGWSQGGNILINHMGVAGEGCLLHAAMAVSPAMDPAAIDAHFHGTVKGRLYRGVIVGPLLGYYLRHRAAMGYSAIQVLRGFATGRFFESLAVPLGHYGRGEGGMAAYHREATSAARVGQVRTPLLVVASEDDPIVPLASLPLAEMEANPSIVTAVTRHGGHMGYTAGLSPLRHTWVDRILVHCLQHWLRQPADAASSDAPAAAGPAEADAAEAAAAGGGCALHPDPPAILRSRL